MIPEEDGPVQPAVRLGLRMIGGLPEEAASRLASVRREGRFVSVHDVARRTGLDRKALRLLAAAGALEGLSGNRYRAGWQVTGMGREQPLIREGDDEVPVTLPSPTEGDDIIADYAALGLTLHRHPLALLRGHLRRRGVMTAAEIPRQIPGRIIRAAGIVINRQRPASANNVTFITLEDETGQVNLVVWRQVAERQRRVMLGARLMAVTGQVQREESVVHVIVRRLWDYTPLLGGLLTHSRDFH